MKQKLKLLTMSDIQAEEVRWLWQPYLPRGKITIIQVDPGDGKITFVLALTALLTRGLPMPNGGVAAPPTNVIYQTAEDGLAGTIRPRLDALGADCSRVLVIDEGDHIHSHFIVNSVSLEDGKKLHLSTPELETLRRINDQVCLEFGLPVFQPQKREKVKSISGAEYHAAARGESWKFRLMNTIDECMKYARSREEFITLIRSEGYDVRWTDSRKNITYTTPEGKKCRDDRLHEEKYLKEVMEHEFAIRARLIAGRFASTQPAGEHTTTAGNPSYGRGVVGAEHGGNGHGRNFGGAGHSPGGAGGAFTERPCGETVGGTANTTQGVHSGTAGNSQSDGTGWQEEREALFHPPAPHRPAPPVPSLAAGHPDVGGIVRGLVRLGYALEHDRSPAPLTPYRGHGDRKTLRKEWEKKIALGHKEDDHEEEQTLEQTI